MTNEPVIPDFGEASACVSENRFFCTDWVRDNWGPVLQPRLIEHIELTLIAVGIGFVIWDAWNSSHNSEIILALVYVGIIGFVLDRIIAGMAKFVTRGTALN